MRNPITKARRRERLLRRAMNELKRLGADVNFGAIGHHKIYHALKRELERKP